MSFVPDTGDAEAYVCLGFDIGTFDADTIGAVHWSVASGGALRIHHALLYAVTTDFPDGPGPCDGMPEQAVGLHLWSPGGDDLVLPSNTGLRLPEGVRRFVIEAHVIRVDAGVGEQSRVTLCGGPTAPRHVAALMGVQAPVPAIRPFQEERSQGTCALAGDVHLWSVWPHMHLAGKEIVGELIGREGARGLVDVLPWDFNEQKTYPLDVDAARGDEIRTTCIWDNATSNYILPGPRTENEMCNEVFVAWPAEAAVCR